MYTCTHSGAPQLASILLKCRFLSIIEDAVVNYSRNEMLVEAREARRAAGNGSEKVERKILDVDNIFKIVLISNFTLEKSSPLSSTSSSCRLSFPGVCAIAPLELACDLCAIIKTCYDKFHLPLYNFIRVTTEHDGVVTGAAA